MKRLTKKQNWFKMQKLTAKDRLYVGLDVHKNSIAAAFHLNGRIVHTFSTTAQYAPLIKQLLPLKKALRLIVYEAGPTGFGLARALQAAGLTVRVVAPTTIARPAQMRTKTDRLDCRSLAESAAKGDFKKTVAIPTPQQEAQRQLLRLRDQLVSKRRRVRQQIKSFLLQHGLDQRFTFQHWTQKAITELRQLELHPALRFTLDIYLSEMDHLHTCIDEVEAQLKALCQSRPHRSAMAILQSHPGVGPATAWSFHLELFRPQRFTKPSQVAAFIGLSPRLHQTGTRSRGGPIVKTGRQQLRSKLIEASWIWIQHDSHARNVYHRLYRNSGNGNKAIVGMARRLAIHLWTMLCTQQCYHPAA